LQGDREARCGTQQPDRYPLVAASSPGIIQEKYTSFNEQGQKKASQLDYTHTCAPFAYQQLPVASARNIRVPETPFLFLKISRFFRNRFSQEPL
jgi:hypothetical protein